MFDLGCYAARIIIKVNVFKSFADPDPWELEEHLLRLHSWLTTPELVGRIVVGFLASDTAECNKIACAIRWGMFMKLGHQIF